MKNIFLFIITISLLFSFSLYAENVKHTVVKGDTFYSISKKYNLTIDELCKANNCTKNDVLKIGQVLVIPQKSVTQTKTLPEAKITMPQKTDTYTVQKGDTLYSIAKRFDISVDILKILNEMSGSTIKVGQKITVPQKAESVSAVTKTELTKVQNPNPVAQPVETTAKANYDDPRKIDTNKKVNTSIMWPIKTEDISYVNGKVSGVLLNGKKSEDVQAIKGGIVMFSGIYRGFGQVVFVQPSTDMMYVYTGLEAINVKKGEKVDSGDVLGKLGIDMHSGKPQLNFMVFKNNKPIDPAKAPRG